MSVQLSNICYVFIIINFVSRNEYSLAVNGDDDNNEEDNLTISNRIVGGHPVLINKLPFMVSMQWRHDSEHYCGGSYIKPRFVLTAAHCLCLRMSHGRWTPFNPWLFVVVAGSTNLKYAPTWQIQNIYRLIPHQRFNFRTMIHDVGLIQLVEPFHLTSYVNFINIPKRKENHEESENCMTTGWGNTKILHSATLLRQVEIPLMNNEECGKYLGGEIPDTQMCAGRKEGGVDACQGDSGGPLICNETQVGIVSWGYGCAERQSPGVYTRVDHYLHWINRAMMRSHSSIIILNHYYLVLIILIPVIFNSYFILSLNI